MTPKFKNSKEARSFYSNNKDWLNDFENNSTDSDLFTFINFNFFTNVFNLKLQSIMIKSFLNKFITDSFDHHASFKLKSANLFYFFEYENIDFFIFKNKFYFLNQTNVDIETVKNFKYLFLFYFFEYCIKNKNKISTDTPFILNTIISKRIKENEKQFFLIHKLKGF